MAESHPNAPRTPQRPPQPPQKGPQESQDATQGDLEARKDQSTAESQKAVQKAAQEPRKDEEGKVEVAPVTLGTMAIPHEDDDDTPEPPRPDVTVPGGRYQVGDKIVNAHGEVLGDAPKPRRK